MGGTCSTDGTDEKYIKICVCKLKGRRAYLSLGGKIILKLVLRK